MKRYLTIFAAILIPTFTTLSCEESEPVQKDPQKISLQKKSAEILRADKAFGFEIFREVLALSDADNIMISPISISYALGMTYNGAAGTTLDAFNRVLHFEGLSAREVNESYQDLMNQMVNLDEQVKFSIANSIWYRTGFQVLDEFVQTNKEFFDAAVREIDFSDPLTLKIINQWIEDNTNGKIREMLDYIPGNAVMYLINAIYFNAKWKYEFVKEDTYEGDFNGINGAIYQADYMRISGNFTYTVNEEFTAVELPYGDSTFSMVVMVPSEGKEVTELVAILDTVRWDSWFVNSTFRGVRIDLPRFKYGYKDLLNEPLINLGLGVAFNAEADFTRINPGGGLYISRVIHQTFIDVQEEGTEAAAATIVELYKNGGGGGGNPIYFKADKPFLYVIKENSTGAILFMGKVGKPEYE